MPTYEITTEDVEYLRHGDKKLIARLYKPKSDGPFPAVVDLHGGAWTSGDLTGTQGLDEALAKNGFVVASLEFRHNADGYPTSLVDINHAIRWIKAHARDLKVDPNRIGIGGASSGGHLAMLAAMRPNDQRYASAPLPAGSPAVDATVRAVAMSWPVINPLSRYRNAQKAAKTPNPPAFSIGMKEKHDLYWKTEAAMAEGNPMLMLERGEKVTMPPALWVQGRPDIVHDYHDDDFKLPGQRARALHLELPQCRRRHRDRLYRQRKAAVERFLRPDHRVLQKAPRVTGARPAPLWPSVIPSPRSRGEGRGERRDPEPNRRAPIRTVPGPGSRIFRSTSSRRPFGHVTCTTRIPAIFRLPANDPTPAQGGLCCRCGISA